MSNENTHSNENESTPHTHAHWIKLWADGVPIEYKAGGKWIKVIEFNTMTMPDIEYRVKPGYRWKPKRGEKYFYLNISDKWEFYVDWDKWINSDSDNALYCQHNIFQTEEEAEAAKERVKATLKGDTKNVDVEKVWITENDIAGGLQLTVDELKERFRELSKENEQLKIRNENLNRAKEVLISKQSEFDGKSLSDGEKALIRAFRNGRLCRRFTSDRSLIVEGHDKVPCGVTTHRHFIAFFMYSPTQDGEVRSALDQIKQEHDIKYA